MLKAPVFGGFFIAARLDALNVIGLNQMQLPECAAFGCKYSHIGIFPVIC